MTVDDQIELGESDRGVQLFAAREDGAQQLRDYELILESQLAVWVELVLDRVGGLGFAGHGGRSGDVDSLTDSLDHRQTSALLVTMRSHGLGDGVT